MIRPSPIVVTSKVRAFLCLLILLMSGSTTPRTNVSQLKQRKNTLYFGCFQDLPDVDFCILYDGEVVDLCDAAYSIKDQLLANLNILFVDPEKIHFTTEENTVLNLNLETKDYKYYHLSTIQFPTPSATRGNYTSSWQITEKNIDGTVPFNTIVIPLNPNTVTIGLQNVTWKPNNLAVKLPSIKLTSNNNLKTLKALMVEGYLKTITLKPFHAKQRVKSVVQNAIKISMIV